MKAKMRVVVRRRIREVKIWEFLFVRRTERWLDKIIKEAIHIVRIISGRLKESRVIVSLQR